MELRLQKFIGSMEILSEIRNLDPSNVVLVNLEHPITGNNFVTVASIPEPTNASIPINSIWVVLDSYSPLYKKCLKLRSWDSPQVYTPGVGVGSLVTGTKRSWTLINTYAEIFSNNQYYASGANAQGPKGPLGDPGPTGAPPVIDYPYILAHLA